MTAISVETDATTAGLGYILVPCSARETFIHVRSGTDHETSTRSEILRMRDLRERLGSFVEDWDDPAMDVYDEL